MDNSKNLKTAVVIVVLICLLCLLFISSSTSCKKKSYEDFVVIPGKLSSDTCLATCSGDSQCITALYHEKDQRCSVAKEFETPDDGEVAYIKLDAKQSPQTFIRSDTEERIDLAAIGAVGQGLPIDWTQETILDAGGAQAEFDRQYGQFINQQKEGFVSDIDVAYGAGGSKEGNLNLCNKYLRDNLPWPLEEPSELSGAITGPFLIHPNNSMQYVFMKNR